MSTHDIYQKINYDLEKKLIKWAWKKNMDLTLNEETSYTNKIFSQIKATKWLGNCSLIKWQLLVIIVYFTFFVELQQF